MGFQDWEIRFEGGVGDPRKTSEGARGTLRVPVEVGRCEAGILGSVGRPRKACGLETGNSGSKEGDGEWG